MQLLKYTMEESEESKHSVSHLQFSSDSVQPFLLKGVPMAVEGCIAPAALRGQERNSPRGSMSFVTSQSPRRRKLCRPAATSTFQGGSIFEVCDLPPVEMRLG